MFFILNILFTWVFWSIAIFFGGFVEFLGFLFYIIGGTGPLVSALVVIGIREGSQGIRDIFSNMTKAKTIQAKWFLLASLLIFIPVIFAVIVEIIVLETSTAITNALVFFSGISNWGVSVIFNLIAATLEEPGWRGVALASLQKRYDALLSSLIVGVFWAFWHLPLFIMTGTYQESIGLGTIGFWLYISALPATSILITWFYNSSQSSVLAAILYHLLNNLAGEIFSLDIVLEGVRVVLSYLLVVLVVYRFGYENLRRDQTESS